MNEIKHYDDFTHVLNRMSNDDFAYILTSYAESKGKKLKLLPIFVDKFNSLSWVGYFTEMVLHLTIIVKLSLLKY